MFRVRDQGKKKSKKDRNPILTLTLAGLPTESNSQDITGSGKLLSKYPFPAGRASIHGQKFIVRRVQPKLTWKSMCVKCLFLEGNIIFYEPGRPTRPLKYTECWP